MAATSTSSGHTKDIGKELMGRIDNLEKFFNEQAEREKRVVPGNSFSKLVAPGTDPGWLSPDQVNRLAKSYDPALIREMQATSPGHARKITPFSKALHRILEIQNPRYKQTYGDTNENYSYEQLEKELGYMPTPRYAFNSVKNGKGVIEKASNMAENSGTLGGYTVPPDFKNEVLKVEEEQSTILSKCTRVPMTTKTATYPSLDIFTNYGTGKSPYESNVFLAWQPEAATINQTNAQLRQFTLSNWDMVTYIVVSNDLLQDNSVGLDGVLTTLLGTAAVFYKEYAFQNGTGSSNSMPLGVLNSPAALGVDRAVSNKIGAADIFTMYSQIQERSRDKAEWWAHQSTIPQLAQLISNSTTGQFAWLNPNGEGVDGPMARRMPMKLWGGGELHFTQACQQLGSTGDLRLIDWSQYFVGERMGQQIAVADQFLFTNNQIVIRSVERIGGASWWPTYVTDAQGFQVSFASILDVHT
jgi:HK97 family phage major capsid protein